MTAAKALTPAPTATDHTSLADALAAFQRHMPAVGKNKTANTGTYSYKFADYADVVDAAGPALAGHGLAFTAAPTLTPEGRFVLRYALLHGASGQERGGDYPLPDPTRTDAQKVGAAVSYARRYCFTAVTNVVPDEDVDGRDVPPATAPPVPVDEAWRRGWLSRVMDATERDPMLALRQELSRAADVRVPREVAVELDSVWLERATELAAAQKQAEPAATDEPAQDAQ